MTEHDASPTAGSKREPSMKCPGLRGRPIRYLILLIKFCLAGRNGGEIRFAAREMTPRFHGDKTSTISGIGVRPGAVAPAGRESRIVSRALQRFVGNFVSLRKNIFLDYVIFLPDNSLMDKRAQFDQSVTQTDAAYGRLHEEILSCRLAPGSKITISEIAQNYGFSTGAVREALSRLSAERMTVATAQKGYSVAEVSVAELKDLTRTRITIEQLCLRAAIAHGDVEWETSVVAAYHRLHRIPPLTPGDSARLNPIWAAAHTTFHAALAGGCDSPWMLTLRAMLYAQTERYRHLSVALAREERDIDIEHKAIVDACLARDAALAERLIDDHLTKTSEIVLDSPLLASQAGDEFAKSA